MNVSINGKKLDAKVVPLRSGFMPSEVKSYLDKNQDGYDSYMVKVGGRDFLVLGKGYQELKAADNLQIDGQRAQVEFLEQEANTAGEGAKKGLFSLDGLGKAALGAVAGLAGLAGGVAALALFGGAVTATPVWMMLAAPAAIGLGVGLLAAVGWGALAGGFSSTDDAVSTALSSGPPGTSLPGNSPVPTSGPVPPPVPGPRPVPPKVDPDPKK